MEMMMFVMGVDTGLMMVLVTDAETLGLQWLTPVVTEDCGAERHALALLTGNYPQTPTGATAVQTSSYNSHEAQLVPHLRG
jgi:hypothetical protein